MKLQYRKVDYVIGCDTDITPLPSEELLAYIDKRFQVTPKDTLVITSMHVFFIQLIILV